jgi:hypothetical protein
MKCTVLLLALHALLSAETFPARQVKPLWPDGQGTVEINDNGITYTQANTKHGLSWKWVDIQYFDRISSKEFVVLTYKDDWRFFGRDREYRFRLTKGDLTDSLFRRMSSHLRRPVTDRVPPGKLTTLYTIPVKHDRTLIGSSGELEFTRDAIYYVTEKKADGRTWLMDRDIVSVWSDDPYRLEIRAYDNNRREFSRTATYKFDLKEKLDPAFYRELKLRLYGLETNHEVIR